jgi:hypothetical protein
VDSAVSAAPDHPDLVVRKFQGTTKFRKMKLVAGVAPPAILLSYNNTITGLQRAVKERVFFVKLNGKFQAPPKPSSLQLYFDRLQCFQDAVRPHLPSTAPVEREQFVQHYKGRKRVVYEQALESLGRKDFSVKDSYVKVFIKYEKTLFTAQKDPVPRVISPRSPRYNIELGCFIQPIEERIFEAIGSVMGSHTVMKGLNARDSARAILQKWQYFKDPVAVGADASRYDQHVSDVALKWEHSIYDLCFRNKKDNRRLHHLLSMQINNKCFGNVGDGSVQYKTTGVRMSGDMTTSLGNCINMCAMAFAYAKHVGVNIQLANNGDDCVYFMERKDLRKFMAGVTDWFLGMGFTMVMEEPVYDVEKISFCQTNPVWVGPGPFDYIMVRDPRVAISKDSLATQPLNTKKEFFGWINAVGQGGLSLTGGLPVWEAFYTMYVNSARGQARSKMDSGWGWGVRQLGKNMSRTVQPVLPRTRASFYLAFGITPREQLCIEKTYGSTVIMGHDDRNVPASASLPY